MQTRSTAAMNGALGPGTGQVERQADVTDWEWDQIGTKPALKGPKCANMLNSVPFFS